MKRKTSEELYNEINNDKNGKIKIQWKNALKERKRLNIIALIICIIVDIIVIYFLIDKIYFTQNFAQISIQFKIMEYMSKIIPIIAIDTVICGIVSMFGKEQKSYKKLFKENIIKKIINNFYDSLEYFPTKQMPERIYDEPGYNEYYNIYYSDDYLEAKIDNQYDIGMAEVKTVEEETRRDSDGNTYTTTTIKFHGLFAKIVIDKSAGCELKINTNSKFTLNKNKLEMDSRRI